LGCEEIVPISQIKELRLMGFKSLPNVNDWGRVRQFFKKMVLNPDFSHHPSPLMRQARIRESLGLLEHI
jgi:hypothetical protein